MIHDKFILQQPADEDEEDGQDEDAEDADVSMDGQDEADGTDEEDDEMNDAPALPDTATILANKRASPLFARLFRSKGEIYLATRPNQAGEWSQAGGMLTINGGRPWFAITDRNEWETGNAEIDALVQHDMKAGGLYGDRRQELVFIGEKLDIEGLEQVLDTCLLNDEEYAGWEEIMKKGSGPNTTDLEERREKEDELCRVFEDGFFEWVQPGDGGDMEHDHAGHNHSH